MNRKKGFTLAELIAVISIIAIILVLAVASFNGISKQIKKKNYEQLESKIKVAGQAYIENTGIKKVFVQTLIDEGYIETDKNSKVIKSPIDKTLLNCFYVVYENNEYLMKESYAESDGSCNLNLVSDAYLSLLYCDGKSCVPSLDIQDNIWIKPVNKAVTLGVKSIDESKLSLEGVTYLWISPLAPNEVGTNASYIVNVPKSGVINEVYELTIKTSDKNYTVSARLMIDQKNPYVENIDNSSNVSSVKATLKDDESKIKWYQVTTSVNPPSEWIMLDEAQNSYEINIQKGKGDYYIWVKDSVGNTNAGDIEKTHVHIEAPVIESLNIKSNKTYNSIYTTASVKVTPVDENDNIKLCLSEENDISKCTWECISASGVNSSTCPWQKNQDGTYSKNYTFNDSEGSGNSHIRYAFVKDEYERYSENIQKTYTLYKSCSVTGNPFTVSEDCSKNCGTGTQIVTTTINDKYLGTECKKYTNYNDCNTFSCCDKTQVKSQSQCLSSKGYACGDSGSQTVYYVSSYDSSISCGNKTVTCNLTPCCAEKYLKKKPKSPPSYFINPEGTCIKRVEYTFYSSVSEEPCDVNRDYYEDNVVDSSLCK